MTYMPFLFLFSPSYPFPLPALLLSFPTFSPNLLLRLYQMTSKNRNHNQPFSELLMHSISPVLYQPTFSSPKPFSYFK